MQIIRELIGKYQATYLIDSDWDYAYTGAADHPILNNLDPLKIAKRLPVESLANIVKVLVLSATDIEMLAEKLTLLGVVVHKHGDENSLDISPENINKWIALQKIGVEEKQFVAFGNDANDISMFQKALYSVRIGDHKGLEEYTTESVSLDENYEKKIIEKLEEISLKFLEQV
ncbi:predicted hydrolase [Paenibacillus popilliae ATCC 14706]|uniref:Predicted hydrolase n=1 Tax=Paenibacillus popilliae ATCC 14706 TaxID=1212764 RepID=M9M1Q8_PAEPP|nr:predicted hydrolase [Paenibacillus popilliae ATCC 14706]